MTAAVDRRGPDDGRTAVATWTNGRLLAVLAYRPREMKAGLAAAVGRSLHGHRVGRSISSSSSSSGGNWEQRSEAGV